MELGDQLGLLTEGGRTRPGRQQTLRATLDWSYDLLAREEQALFQRLSVFAGGFTLEAADVIAGEGEGVLDALERLASKSLVALDHERAEPRFRLLEPIRQYAAERLRQAGMPPSSRVRRGRGVVTLKSADSHHWKQEHHGLKDWQIPEVVVSPNAPNKVFAGTRGDGVWVSEDFGASW